MLSRRYVEHGTPCGTLPNRAEGPRADSAQGACGTTGEQPVNDATTLPLVLPYPNFHDLHFTAINAGGGSVTTDGITTSATPDLLVYIQNNLSDPPSQTAAHNFRLEVLREGAVIGTLTGNAGQVVGDPANPLHVPIDSGMLEPGANELRFRLTDTTANLTITLPDPGNPALTIINDDAASTVSAGPEDGATINTPVMVSAADMEDGVSGLTVTD